jgi:2-C-methyl-D-erythritol 2,4-cyclodiphosphate synthase
MPGIAMTPESIHRVGIGTDLHRLAAGRRLVLGHVAIEHEAGSVGHSDGDVVLHAIIDAMGGAAGLPDIGEMFPDTDPAYEGVDSSVLLERALGALGERGYAVVNVDVTIHLERPKLKPYKEAIRREVARLLRLEAEAVGIKAKTNEGMDAVGRGEAIACTAVVGLKKKDER